MIPTVYAVDGNWHIHRAFYTVRRVPGWDDEKFARAIAYRVVAMITGDMQLCGASHMIVAFDGPLGFRHKLYKLYKSSRSGRDGNGNGTDGAVYGQGLPDREVYRYMDALKDYLTMLNIKWVQLPEYEADDVLHAIAQQANVKTYRAVLGTSGHDNYQSLHGLAAMFYWQSHTKTHVWVKKADAEKRIGLRIDQMVEYQTLLGDAGDDIPQFRYKFGPKSIQKVLAAHDTIQGWYKAAPAKIRAELIQKQKFLKRNRQLVQLVADCCEFRLSDAVIGPIPKTKSAHPPSYYAMHEYLNGLRLRTPRKHRVADIDDILEKPSRLKGRRL